MSRSKQPPPEPQHACAFDKPDSLGVRAALDNLMHYHLMHTTGKFSAWCKPVSAAIERHVSEVEILIISDPKLLERIRKVVEIPTADPGVTIH